MPSSNDNGDGEGSADSNVNLSGRLRNPGPNTTEIEPHDEDESDEAVDQVGERLRSDGSTDANDGPTLDEQTGDEQIEAEEDLEDSLLDALESDEDASNDDGGDSRDTNSGIASAEAKEDRSRGERAGDGTSPGTGETSSPDISNERASASSGTRSREKTNQRRNRTSEESTSDDADQSSQTCPECDSVSPSGMRFCVQCGASLRNDNDRDHVGAPALDRNKLDDDVESGFALVSIEDDGTDGTSIPLRSSETVVGREGDSRFPTDEFLDPEHTRLTLEDGDLYLEDLNSLNGTYIKLHDEVRLHPGDTFLMGRQVLRFERIDQDLDSKKTADDGTRYMGSPAPGGQFKILQIGVGELVQNIYCLPESGVVLGREKGDIIFPRDKFMSGRHARIFTEEEPYLVDLNSSNGTWIKLWEKRQLEGDDYVFMGQQLFRVELPD